MQILMVPISEIVIPPDRQRMAEEDDDNKIADLAESIKTYSLLNPIILEGRRLIAGKRRLEAYKLLGREEIPARQLDELDELERTEIEYHENKRRKQLTWKEDALAVERIHKLRLAKDPSWTIEKTAQSLNISYGKASEDLSIVKMLDNTAVATRPTRQGAITTAKRERENELVRELARRRSEKIVREEKKPQQSKFPAVHFGGGVAYNADCLDVLAEMEPYSIDLVVMDPPWGVNLAEASQWTRRWVHSYDDSPDLVYSLLPKAFKLIARVLKPGAHFYTFLPIQEAPWWIDQLGEVGLVSRARPLVWHKTQAGMSDVYQAFMPTYEVAVWGFKPDAKDNKRLFSRPLPDAFDYPRQPGKYHENEKPLELLEQWIEASSSLGEVVLDPFGGGFSTAAAAFRLGRFYVTIEQDEANFSIGTARLRALEEGIDSGGEEAPGGGASGRIEEAPFDAEAAVKRALGGF